MGCYQNYDPFLAIDSRTAPNIQNYGNYPCRGFGFGVRVQGIGFRVHLGGCQNYGPFLGTLNIRCRIIIGTQKGTIILTTTHLYSD